MEKCIDCKYFTLDGAIGRCHYYPPKFNKDLPTSERNSFCSKFEHVTDLLPDEIEVGGEVYSLNIDEENGYWGVFYDCGEKCIPQPNPDHKYGFWGRSLQGVIDAMLEHLKKLCIPLKI